MPIAKHSFINEHTAEYYLVPQLNAALSQYFAPVIPFYYWRTREGGLLSRRGYLKARVVAVYARRPKLDKKFGLIHMKINQPLFDHAHALTDKGIPVFAGIPIAKSIDELSMDMRCRWFHLSRGWECEIPLNEDQLPKTVGVTELNLKEFPDAVARSAKELSWNEIHEHLKYQSPEAYYRSFFRLQYKPVYFLLPVS